eukprot:COSAG01_NODE_748_length_13852_cov_46.032502_3_plen_125_part_00
MADQFAPHMKRVSGREWQPARNKLWTPISSFPRLVGSSKRYQERGAPPPPPPPYAPPITAVVSQQAVAAAAVQLRKFMGRDDERACLGLTASLRSRPRAAGGHGRSKLPARRNWSCVHAHSPIY